jgi:hypothetical protein
MTEKPVLQETLTDGFFFAGSACLTTMTGQDNLSQF